MRGVTADAALPSVAVVGLGLIGGSLALSLAAEGYPVYGYDADAETRKAAAEVGIPVVESAAAAGTADLVVLAVPMPGLDAVLAELRPALATNSVLTDVASVKSAALELVGTHGLAGRYVGGHPMAGTQHSGFAAASADLLPGATWVLCLEPETRPESWLRAAGLVTRLGCRVVPATAAEHDTAVARVSHLPHVLAELLARTAADGAAGPLALTLAAGSFRDGTRVAATRPELVQAMCAGNAAALSVALDDVAAGLAQARRDLADGRGLGELGVAGHDARLRWEHLSAADTPRAPWVRRRDDPRLAEDLLGLGRSGGWVSGVDDDAVHGVTGPDGADPTQRSKR